MKREDEKNGVLFFDYNMARGEFEKKLYNMFVKEDYSLDTIISWAISYGELHNRWISVDDELPKEHEWIIGFSLKRSYIDVYNFDSNGLIEAHGITHWMPLPQSPKKGGEK